MKYVGVTHSFNDTDYTDITRFSIRKIYWSKFDEEDLGSLDDVKMGQLVLVDTGRGFSVGRIVRTSGDGLSLARNSGMNEEDVTREVVGFVNKGLLTKRDRLVDKLKAEK